MARSTVLRTGGLSVDTTDFRRFATDLRKANPVLNRQMRARLRAAGNIVADEARRMADSAKVEATIRVSVSGSSVAILAGRPGRPLPGLRELGNQGATTAEPYFKHPVFGNREVWVKQPTHPFLAPALAAKGAEAAEAIFEALTDAVRVAAGG